MVSVSGTSASNSLMSSAGALSKHFCTFGKFSLAMLTPWVDRARGGLRDGYEGECVYGTIADYLELGGVARIAVVLIHVVACANPGLERLFIAAATSISQSEQCRISHTSTHAHGGKRVRVGVRVMVMVMVMVRVDAVDSPVT